MFYIKDINRMRSLCLDQSISFLVVLKHNGNGISIRLYKNIRDHIHFLHKELIPRVHYNKCYNNHLNQQFFCILNMVNIHFHLHNQHIYVRIYDISCTHTFIFPCNQCYYNLYHLQFLNNNDMFFIIYYILYFLLFYFLYSLQSKS